MSRVQLAFTVGHLDSAVAFYVNFAVTEPPLELVLIEGHGTPGTMNHLGVEVETSDDVQVDRPWLVAPGSATVPEDNVPYCYAVQDKVWVGC